MKEEKDKLRDFMQEVFHDYEVAPDPQEWKRIEESLAKRKSKKLITWIVWSAAACLILLLALYTEGIFNRTEKMNVRTAVNMYPKDKTPPAVNISLSPTATENNVSEIKPASKSTEKNISVRKSLPESQPSGKIVQSKIQVNTATAETKIEISTKSFSHKGNIAEQKENLLAATQPQKTLPEVSKAKSLNVSSDQTPSVSNKTETKMPLIHSLIPRQIDLIAYQNRSFNLSDLQFSIPSVLNGDQKNALADNLLPRTNTVNASDVKFKGLSLSNSSGVMLQTSGKEMMSYSTPFALQLASNMFSNSVKVFDNSLLSSLNIGNLFQKNSRHYLPPVTYGLNVNLSLNKNWSIETGLQYTRLQSSGVISISSSNAIQIKTSFGYKVDENLYYLGVPFILNYNFAQQRKTSYYLSAGLSVEKGLIAKYKATPTDNYPGMDPIYSHNPISGLQYSFNSGVGISYRFLKHFELFGQPSLTWYFNSNEKNTTVYSVHPLIFNLRTGIRYSIR